MEAKYHISDGDRMHGPLTYEQFAALLDSGTLSTDAQWMRESEREFRPVSDLASDPTLMDEIQAPPVMSTAAPAPMVSYGAPPQPVVVVVQQGRQRSTTAAKIQAGGVATIATVMLAPIVLAIIGLVATAVVIFVLIGLVATSQPNPPEPSAGRAKVGLPKATAKVFALDGMIYLENTTTNVWQGGELIIDPIGERYRIALGSVPPNQLMEFSAADFATLKGDRFPVASKVPRMVSVQPAGMEASVHTLR